MSRVVAPFLALILIAGSVPARAAAPGPTWQREIASLLQRRAAAVMTGDRRAFEATMAAAPAAFREEKLRWFDRIRALPLRSYRLPFATLGYDDLSSALERAPRGDEVRVVQVTERLTLAGYDERPSAEDLFLTVVRRDGRWSIVDDSGLDDLGLLSARSPWDFAPVQRLERDGVMVLHHDDPATAEQISRATIDAVARVRASWPRRWRPRVVVVIPRSERDLARIFQTTIDLGPFVAFASSSIERDEGAFTLTGFRVYLQPDTFFSAGRAFREDTLGHEILHVATRHESGLFHPLWLEEGVAQVFGERATPPTAELARRVRTGDADGLPDDWVFFLGSRAEIRYAYEASAHFVGYLVQRFGRRAIPRFYAALGAESPVSFGTARYHLDRAARTVFRTGFGDLERAWRARLKEEFG